MEQIYSNVIATLNTTKLLAKACHWAETSSMNKHEQLDNLYNLIVEFQDEFAEEGFTLFDNIDFRIFHSCSQNIPNINNNNPELLMDFLLEYIVDIKCRISELNDCHFAGLESIIDNFIHDLNIIIYRFKMN